MEPVAPRTFEDLANVVQQVYPDALRIPVFPHGQLRERLQHQPRPVPTRNFSDRKQWPPVIRQSVMRRGRHFGTATLQGRKIVQATSVRRAAVLTMRFFNSLCWWYSSHSINV